MREIHREEYQLPREILFKDFAEKWLGDYAKPRVKLSTYRFYEHIIRPHLIPHFGTMKLNSVTAHDIEVYIAGRIEEGRLSNTSIGYHLRVLRAIFKQAIIWEYLAKNPAKHIKKPRVEKEEIEVLSAEEIRRFLDNVSERYYPLFLMAIMSGMRRGELFALRWSDINRFTNQIHVRRSYVLGNFDEPKSRAAVRQIPMPPLLVAALEKHRRSCPPSEYDLVFPNEVGNPINASNFYKREFYPALARASLRRIRFHDLRHTFASLLIAQGENIKFIQEQLGHTSTRMTLDKYGHLIPSVSYESENRLQKSIFGENVCTTFAERKSKEPN